MPQRVSQSFFWKFLALRCNIPCQSPSVNPLSVLRIDLSPRCTHRNPYGTSRNPVRTALKSLGGVPGRVPGDKPAETILGARADSRRKRLVLDAEVGTFRIPTNPREPMDERQHEEAEEKLTCPECGMLHKRSAWSLEHSDLPQSLLCGCGYILTLDKRQPRVLPRGTCRLNDECPTCGALTRNMVWREDSPNAIQLVCTVCGHDWPVPMPKPIRGRERDVA